MLQLSLSIYVLIVPSNLSLKFEKLKAQIMQNAQEFI